MITIGGLPGTGTTTVSRILSERLGMEHVYVGQMFRDMAEERGMTIEEFNVHVEENLDIDQVVDERQVEVARRGGIILEGRMSGYLLQKAGVEAFHVWLTGEIGERARRIGFREGEPTEDALEDMRAREASEWKRYKELYDFDHFDRARIQATFDLVIDTTPIPAVDVADIIEGEYRRRQDAR